MNILITTHIQVGIIEINLEEWLGSVRKLLGYIFRNRRRILGFRQANQSWHARFKVDVDEIKRLIENTYLVILIDILIKGYTK